MPQDTERVEYIFEGDNSSLKETVESSISLLNKLRSSFNTVASGSSFVNAEKDIQNLNSSFDKTFSKLNKVKESLQSVGDVKLPKGSASFNALNDTIQNLESSLKSLQSSEGASATGVQQLGNTLEGSSESIQSASSQIGRLISSEQRFQNVQNTIASGVTSFKNQLDNLKSGLDSTFDPATGKLGIFSRMFSSVSNTIQSFKDRAETAFSRTSSLLDTVTAAFRRTSQASDDNASSTDAAQRSHENLSKSAQDISDSVSEETKSIDNEKKSLKSKDNALKTSKGNHTSLATTIKTLSSNISEEISKISSLTTAANKNSGAFNKLGFIVTNFVQNKLSNWFSSAITNSIKFVENVNLFQVAMGNAATEGASFVSRMSEIYGMDPSNLYKTSGFFYQLTDAINMSSEASKNISLSLTKASNDIASLFNMPIEEVTQNLASGMQGMSRAVRKYGMDIRATTLQQTALKYGITEQVETMSEANRMALRYITMMEQAENALKQTTADTKGAAAAMGDFAMNIETPANQLRIFKEQMSQLGRAIANFIVAPFSKAIAYINGFIMALRTVINFIGKLFGSLGNFGGTSKSITSGATNAANAIGGVGDAAGAAAEKVKDLTAPFDELNVLQENASAGGGGGGAGGETFDDLLDPALDKAISDMSLKLENIQMKANKVRDEILKTLGLTVDSEGNAVAIVGGFVDNLVKAWQAQDYTKVGVIIAEFLNQGLDWALSNLTWENLGPKIEEHIHVFTDMFNGFVSAYDWASLGTVVGNGINIAVNTGLTFVDSIDWSQLGSSFATSFNNMISTIDWNHVGELLWSGFGVAITVLGTFLANLDPAVLSSAVTGLITSFLDSMALTISQVDWTKIGENIGAALAGIDWLGILTSLVNVVLALLPGVLGLITGFISGFFGESDVFAPLTENLQGPLEAINSLLDTLSQSFTTLWEEHIQPVIDSIGEFLQPVLETISSLLGNIAAIVEDAIGRIEAAYKNAIEPMLAATSEGIETLMGVLQNLWDTVIGPIVEWIGDSLQRLWENYIGPLFQHLSEVCSHIMELLMNLWNNVLAPIVNYIVSYLGPIITGIVKGIWSVVEWVIGAISNAIDTILEVLDGVIEFLNGVFTGDWKRALSGLLNIFVALGNGIIGAIENVCNFGINAINTFIDAIFGAVKGVINSVGGMISGIAKFLGFDIDLSVDWSAPQIPNVTIPRIPKVALATGGVVTSPTQALIGEGQYDEAVIPLGNSPQMRELVQEIVDAIKNDPKGNNPQPVNVRVYIGDKEWDAFTYKSAERGKKLVGATPISEV